MKKLNNYIVEAWSGVKKRASNAEIKSWCDEMEIENYTINSQGEIDVDGDVSLTIRNIEELPYKFGEVSGNFDIGNNPKLMSLENCPDFVGGMFNCSFCPKLDSLEGCPKQVKEKFWCMDCKRTFTKEEVRSLCKVRGSVKI